ncbi:hypothetical protein Gorai_023543, partial [Gossypium raimondii]|nr:hypothetical protein [Gossypium raimondii]
MSSLEVVSASESRSADDRETIKFRFKKDSGVEDVEMLEDLDSPSKGSDSPTKVSWKYMFIGKGEQNQDENLKSLGKNCDGDLEFLEGDVKKSMVNDIPTIEFSERIQQIIFKGMETTIVLKLLGQNIGYATLFNRINSLWRIPEEVGGLVGKVVKFDLNNDSKTRGCFAKMVVFVDLDKPLVSQVMVNKEIQRVDPRVTLLKGRPFKFLVGWVEHSNFSEFVKEKWCMK